MLILTDFLLSADGIMTFSLSKETQKSTSLCHILTLWSQPPVAPHLNVDTTTMGRGKIFFFKDGPFGGSFLHYKATYKIGTRSQVFLFKDDKYWLISDLKP